MFVFLLCRQDGDRVEVEAKCESMRGERKGAGGGEERSGECTRVKQRESSQVFGR